jgi:GntR family negative regulator for fad regulon and positive regulator of fabA
VKIRHGKPTRINDYWQKGGLSLLGTLAKYGDHLPNGFITHLLAVRVTLLPPVAEMAAQYQPDAIADHLAKAKNLPHDAGSFAAYDWKLQMLMARHAQNPIFPLILNDFGPVFRTIALRYFSWSKARKTSSEYYQRLSDEMHNGGRAVEKIVKAAMQESIEIWQQVKKDAGKGT